MIFLSIFSFMLGSIFSLVRIQGLDYNINDHIVHHDQLSEVHNVGACYKSFT